MMQEKIKRAAYKLEAVRLVKGVCWKATVVRNAIYWKAVTVKNAIYWRFYYSDVIARLVAITNNLLIGFSVFIATFGSQLQKKDIDRFVLVTRGRSGSTAVMNELGKIKALCVTQECFLLHPFTDKREEFLPLELPFDLWKRQGRWWQRMLPVCCRDSRQAHNYLMHMEKLARCQGAKVFGWKVLSHQFDERPYLARLLKKHDYRVMYLRRNIARQVLSGMVANQRGIYSSFESIVDEHRYRINLEEFQWHVKLEQECIKSDRARLSAEGFDFIEMSYEDFCDNREALYGKIFNLLNLPLELPPPSDYKKVIKDTRRVIENYDEVADVAAALGEKL